MTRISLRRIATGQDSRRSRSRSAVGPRFPVPSVRVSSTFSSRTQVISVRMYCIHNLTTKQGRWLTLLENVDYNTGMARPRKAGRLRMDTDQRVPMTVEQKAVIDEAAADEPRARPRGLARYCWKPARRKIAKSRTIPATLQESLHSTDTRTWLQVRQEFLQWRNTRKTSVGHLSPQRCYVIVSRKIAMEF